MGVGWEFPWEWEHKYAKMAMGMGRVHVTMGMATFSRAKIPIGRLDALAPSLRFVLDLSNTLFLQLCSSRQRFPLTQRVARSLCGSTEFLVGTIISVVEIKRNEALYRVERGRVENVETH